MQTENSSRDGIPDGIAPFDIEAAIVAFDSGSVDHRFHDSEKYDLVVGENRYPPKAIVGIAARRVAGRVLEPRDFTGGVGSKCFRILEGMGYAIVPKLTVEDPDGWTDAELDAAVAAYLEMLQAEIQGRGYSKAETNRRLRDGALGARSKGSVEYRMGNISSVLHGLGRKWISGYKPAGNVGARVRGKIMAALVRLEAVAPGEDLPDADPGRLSEKIRKKRRLPAAVPPTGSPEPKKIARVSESFERDPAVVAWVLTNANGVCECCGNPAPFRDADGFPFLEVHHVEPLGEGGRDVIENAVAICPNCHRRCHHAHDRATVKNALYVGVPRLRKR